jgi:multidrug efflux pump subunit AcrB
MTIPVFLFLFISGLMKGGILQTTFFPFIDGDDIDVSLVLKPGTREMETERFLKTIEDKVWEANDELKKQRKDGKDVVLSTRMYLGSAGSGGGAHTGQINVELLPGEERDLPSFVVANAIREKTGPMPEAEEFNIGGRRVFGKPISMSLKSRNLEELEGAKEFVKKELRQMSELKDISDSNIPGRREINLSLKPLAYVLGLTHNDITRQIRQGFFGEEVQRLQIGRDEVKIWLRYPPENRKSLGEMERIRIKTTDGRDFPLTDLVDYDTKRGVVNINHLNGARENRIEADLVDQDQAVDPIIDELTEQLLPAVKAKYPGVLVSFEGQQRSSNQFSDSVSFAGPVALLMIIILISLTFRSFSQAILILLMIPLGISGAILGHWIEGQNLSILSTYGIVALCGVIVNDAVVFTAKYNSLLKEGHTVASAIYYAGKNRFRPIILTSLTTVAGLYPIILEPSRQAQFLVPMAISIAYGVLIGTFFILTLYPALLAVFNDLRVGLNWLLNAGWDWDFRLPDRRDVEPAVDEEKRLEKLM